MNHTPPEEKSFDLIVAGGGLAGLCAAIAAARHGVKVAIVQDRPVFGGNSSSEIRVVPYGCSHSNAWSNETGIMHDILLEDRVGNHEYFFDHGMMNSLYDMTLAEAIRREPNIEVFLNTTIRGALTEPIEGGQRITGVLGSQLGSEREFLFRAPQFIDATGDGTVGFQAGADFRYGREARSEYHEPLAPLVGDDSTLGSTITMRARDIGRPVAHTPPPWIEEYTSLDQIGVDRHLYHLDKPVYGGYWWLEVSHPFHQITDNQEIRAELHRHVLGVWNFIKNHSEHKEAAQNYVLEWIGQIPGKRESRRFMGDVVITEHDCHEDRNWADGIGYAGWWIDLHQKGGILNHTEPGERENVDGNYKHWIRVSPFSLPLRAYYSRNVENLWLAGRVMSVTHAALGPVRVQLSLAAAGQAVGTAAAYAVKHGLTPRATASPEGPHIAKIRQALLKDDVRLLGAVNEDPTDLARQANPTATSEALLDFGGPKTDEWISLRSDWAQVIPLTHDRVETVAFYLKNETDHSVAVVAELQKLERIWDRGDGSPGPRAELIVAPKSEGWNRAEFHVAVEAGRPYRVILKETPGILWSKGTHWPIGTVAQYRYTCPGGAEPKNAHFKSLQIEECEIPAYVHWRQAQWLSFAVQVTPCPAPFGAANVNNGRAWPEDLPNIWLSDPREALPQAVSLEWDSPVAVNIVYVSFDTGLHYTMNDRTPFHRAPECVRHWRLWAKIESGWVQVYEEVDNYQRRRRATFDEITTRSLKLEVLSTHGNASAAVYEIRAYRE